jgi:eukaryotic-like serine/threonine-protein kinase
MHSMDALGSVPLPGTETAYLPFWSPDSRFVAFFSVPGELKKIDISRGAPQTICDLPARSGAGGSWNQDGVIVFGTVNMPLRRVSADGGEPQPALELNISRRETMHAWPHFLPDGRHFLYLATSVDARENATLVGSLDSRQSELVLAFASNASYITPGFLIYASQQRLLAQKFSAKTFRVTGAPFPIVEHVEQASLPGISLSKFSISQDGVLVYRGGNSGKVHLPGRESFYSQTDANRVSRHLREAVPQSVSPIVNSQPPLKRHLLPSGPA